jgi:hypothetical protein
LSGQLLSCVISPVNQFAAACASSAVVSHLPENYMTSFDAHWLNYLARRSKLTTRLLQYFGLVFGQVLGVTLALWFQSWGYLMICPVAYGVAQLSRETIWGAKKNTYITKAIFSVMSFFRMMILDVTGKLRPEIERIKQPVV